MLSFVPFNLSRQTLSFFSKHMPISLHSMQGPREPLSWERQICIRSISCFSPPICKELFTASIVAHNEVLTVGLTTDNYRMEDGELLGKIVSDKMLSFAA